MAKLLQIGIVYPNEMRSGIGHVACTLGGVNYESRGGRGCLKGSAARGAAHPLFKHRFHRVLTDAQAKAAKEWADRCIGLTYVWAAVPVLAPPPKKGGDCSGFMSGILCAAEGKPITRRFSTGIWKAHFKALGFAEGLGSGLLGAAAIGVADRPYPGTPVGLNSPKKDHVKWIQARLNFAAGNRHAVLGGKPLAVDGDFGPKTQKVVVAFQKRHGLQGLGMCGPKTWPLLNAIR
ncbi:peptidoglycan-binding domain-containing protein [Micromonospora sp. NPDC007271]|uniref:peptidoglycan-binding domain-containing protein n=1 Tax=Micromonospora sp. NPDC007271 TaxID=3154587 RepID=UPI003409D438